jgi:hypothetical protein
MWVGTQPRQHLKYFRKKSETKPNFILVYSHVLKLRPWKSNEDLSVFVAPTLRFVHKTMSAAGSIISPAYRVPMVALKLFKMSSEAYVSKWIITEPAIFSLPCGFIVLLLFSKWTTIVCHCINNAKTILLLVTEIMTNYWSAYFLKLNCFNSLVVKSVSIHYINPTLLYKFSLDTVNPLSLFLRLFWDIAYYFKFGKTLFADDNVTEIFDEFLYALSLSNINCYKRNIYVYVRACARVLRKHVTLLV